MAGITKVEQQAKKRLVKLSYEWLVYRMRHKQVNAKEKTNIALRVMSAELGKADGAIVNQGILQIVRHEHGSQKENSTKEVAGRLHLHRSTVSSNGGGVGDRKVDVSDSEGDDSLREVSE